MTKNHICSKDFPEIIDYSRKFKESRTKLNFPSNLKIQVLSIIKTFPEKKTV